jgi:hypothetical protein
VAYVKNGTLVANTQATVTIDEGYPYVDVCNVDGAAVMVFTVDGTTADTTATADNMFTLPAAISSFRVRVNANQAVTVKLKSTGTPRYSVTGIAAGIPS